MATLDHVALSEPTRPLPTYKPTPTPIMIDKIALPEHEDTDITTNTLHTTSYMYSIHSPPSIQSFTSTSMSEPIITPGITPINDTNHHLNGTHELKIKTQAPNKSNKYYRSLRNSPITQRREENIEIHAKRRYELDDGRIGICQFIGQTSFANGVWVGIVLENSADGNTNGTIYGRKYFQCREGKGLFVRPNKIIKALGSAFKTRTSTKSKKKPASFVPLTHQKSVSSSDMLAMSTSSPLHLEDNANLDGFIDIDDIIDKNHFKSQSIPNKLKLKKGSKSQTAEEISIPRKLPKKYKNKPKKYKSKGLRSKASNQATFAKKFNITPSPIAMSFTRHKKRISSQRTPVTPSRFSYENLGARSANTSPYDSQTNTPSFNAIHSAPSKLADIPVIALESITSQITDDINAYAMDSGLESGSPLYPYGLNIGGGTPVDTFAALRAYIGQQEGRNVSDEGSKYNGGLWSSDESEGAASDSMLDDEDWVNKQHRARQASLAQTFADAITIPALHSVQQKVAYYIGRKEKWKPPKYDMVPDHSNMLTEKLLHHKKHLDENINDGLSVQKKLGPTDIGTVHGYKLPKYKSQKSDKILFGFKPNGTFLDNDKGWYPKPSKLYKKNGTKKKKDKHVKCQSEGVDSEKSPRTAKKFQAVKKLSFDEETETNKYEYDKKKEITKVGKLCNEHQRSQSQLVRSKAKFKKQKKKHDDDHKTAPNTDRQEWLEDQFTWIPKVELKADLEGNATSKKKKKKNTKPKKAKSKRKKKKRKSRIWVPAKILTQSEKKKRSNNMRISLPPMKTDGRTKQMVLSVSPYLDTPQSTSQSISTDSLSPYFSMENMKSTPLSSGITPLDEFVPMGLIEDDDDKSVDFQPIRYKSPPVPVAVHQENELGENSETESDSMPFIMDITFKMGINNVFESNLKQCVSAGGSVHSLFMTDNVIFEESDTDQYGVNEANKYHATPMPAGKRLKNKNNSASFKIRKKQESKKKNNKQRSQSLFSGSSGKKEKLKQQNDAKNKYKAMNSAKAYVENRSVKMSKSDRKKRRAKSENNRNNKKKMKQKNGNKRKKLKNKIWNKGNGKNPPL